MPGYSNCNKEKRPRQDSENNITEIYTSDPENETQQSLNESYNQRLKKVKLQKPQSNKEILNGLLNTKVTRARKNDNKYLLEYPKKRRRKRSEKRKKTL